MNLICSKCGGKLLVDIENISDNHLEMSCINCGNLLFFHNTKNPTALSIIRKWREVNL